MCAGIRCGWVSFHVWLLSVDLDAEFEFLILIKPFVISQNGQRVGYRISLNQCESSTVTCAEIQQEVADNDKGDTGYANKAYAKACKSIAACPIPYSNLNELLSLQNVGKVMLAKLVKKQKEHYLARGIEIPANGGGGLEVSPNSGGGGASPTPNTTSGNRPKARGKSGLATADDESEEGEGSDSSFNMRLQAGGGSEYQFCYSLTSHTCSRPGHFR
jgi:hypothetical protein